MKTISMRVLEDVFQREALGLHASDPYQAQLFVWACFTCAECGRTESLETASGGGLDARSIAAKAAQAKRDGWYAEPPSATFLSSEAYCPQCAVLRRKR